MFNVLYFIGSVAAWALFIAVVGAFVAVLVMFAKAIL
jgi:hypothetical protein